MRAGLGVGEGWSRLLGLGPEDVFYCVLPLPCGGADVAALERHHLCGSVVLRARFSASHFWPDVRKYGVTVAQYSGEMCRYLFKSGTSGGRPRGTDCAS